MSGGSMNYFYQEVEDASEKFRLSSMGRIAMRSHMIKLAHALRAIERNDSGNGDDKEEELIAECLSPKEVLSVTLSEANRILEELKKEIKNISEEGR